VAHPPGRSRVRRAKARQTTIEFDIFDDVVVHIDDRRIYGTIVAIDDDTLTVREHGSTSEHTVGADALDSL